MASADSDFSAIDGERVSGAFTTPQVEEELELRVTEVGRRSLHESDPSAEGFDEVMLRAELLRYDGAGTEVAAYELDTGAHDFESGLTWELLGTVALGESGRRGIIAKRQDEGMGWVELTFFIVRVDQRSVVRLWEGSQRATVDPDLPTTAIESVDGILSIVFRGQLEGGDPSEKVWRLVYRGESYVDVGD